MARNVDWIPSCSRTQSRTISLPRLSIKYKFVKCIWAHTTIYIHLLVHLQLIDSVSHSFFRRQMTIHAMSEGGSSLVIYMCVHIYTPHQTKPTYRIGWSEQQHNYNKTRIQIYTNEWAQWRLNQHHSKTNSRIEEMKYEDSLCVYLAWASLIDR